MKAPLSIRIIYWLSQITYWLMIVVSGAILIANLFVLTPYFTEEIQLRVQMPVPIEVVEEGIMHSMKGKHNVRIEEAIGKLHFVDTPVFITKIVAKILLGVMLIIMYMVYCFREFITNIKNGHLFENSNIGYLKQIAYGLLVLWLATIVYSQILYHSLVKFLKFDSIVISDQINDYNSMLITALLLWALAHIFVKGHEMKIEQELTV